MREMRTELAISLILIVGVLVGSLVAFVYRPPVPMGGMMGGDEMGSGGMYSDLEWYYTAKTFFSGLNVVILVALLAIYVNIYVKMRTEFTIGLMIFTIILLLYALTSNPILHMMWGFHGYGLGPFAMFPDLFTTIALTILLYLSVK